MIHTKQQAKQQATPNKYQPTIKATNNDHYRN